MTVLPLPPERRYRLTVVNAQNRRSNMGRQFVTFTETDGTVTALASMREGTEIRYTMPVLDVTQQGANAWELAGPDGQLWRVSGCGCGGK